MWSTQHVDLLLLHPPSVYDFREQSILYGPVSDLIPSSTVFEMFPLGFLTIASYLQERGLQVRIVNLALRMINSRRFDVRQFLAGIKPRAVGIDLHWMPHCHGALEIARLVKEVHPDVPVIMGGLSSSYYHEALIRYPQVDFVLRGDSTEPPLHQLLVSLRDGSPLARIPNLTWKQAGVIHVNPHAFVPATLDYVDLRPDLMVDMVLRYRDLQSVLPFNGWWRNPITTVFTVKGCACECVTCGSSSTACQHLTHRQRPVFRSPNSLVNNLTSISRLIKGPIFLVGDLRQAGDDYAREVLAQLKAAQLPNEVVFEFFTLPPTWFLDGIDQALPRWSVEFSPESHDPAVRDAQEGETGYDNAAMEAFFELVLARRCHRLDVFFMIGLPAQTALSVQGTVDYCERLLSLFDRRLSCFISPMGPFSDPGSRCFEDPDAFGYRLFAHTLEDHRQLLVQPTWEHILNYETKWMTRSRIVDATYDAAAQLNLLKVRFGRISRRRGARVAQRIVEARDLRNRLEREIAQGENGSVSDRLKGEIKRYSMDTVCDKRELFWPRHLVNFRLAELCRLILRYLFRMGTVPRVQP